MTNPFPILFIAAPPWGGKSTILEILAASMSKEAYADGDKNIIIADPHFPVLDMSTVVKWHRSRPETELGKTFLELKKMEEENELLPDEPIIEGICAYLKDWQQTNGDIYQCVLAGAPRTADQSEMLMQQFPDSKLVHVSTTLEEIMDDLALKGKRSGRTDGDNDVPERFHKHESMTVPGIMRFMIRRPSHMLTLNRKDKMAKKIRSIIPFMGLRSLAQSRFMHRTKERDQLAYQLIQKYDEERARQHAPAAAATSAPHFESMAAMVGSSSQMAQARA